MYVRQFGCIASLQLSDEQGEGCNNTLRMETVDSSCLLDWLVERITNCLHTKLELLAGVHVNMVVGGLT